MFVIFKDFSIVSGILFKINVYGKFQTNPPYYVPLVELLPSQWADSDVLVTTKDLMKKMGQAPITVKKQKDGLVLNRLQNAIFKECFDLFRVSIYSETC